MAEFKVVEKFESINGEGQRAGQLAIFIRFKGCNLKCSYCDTKWANELDADFEVLTDLEIYNYIKQTGISNVTLTGGEPLLQEGIEELLVRLSKDKSLFVEIETNGSIDIIDILKIPNGPSVTLDYKLPDSLMSQYMHVTNFENITRNDTVKFVAGSLDDLEHAKKIIENYSLIEKSNVYISAVFGKIELEEIVNFMKINNLNGVSMQLQLHKVIWDSERKGV